ncbi:MAG: hypothetical protein PVF15_02745 [Candidatus Bathyarchaeota archaeon]|jgi:hypothetical protein
MGKKEVAVAVALGVTIAIFSVFSNLYPQGDDSLGVSPLSLDSETRSAPNSASLQQRVRIIDADIQGKLEVGTFEAVVPFIEALTREKGGFIVTESLIFKDGLWRGEIVSKLPPTNASSFTMETRQKIDENGRVETIEIDIREFTSSQDTTQTEQYSTIKTFLSEESEEEKDTPEPVIQLMSVFPIVVTGLVWVAEGLIVGVPLCFASLGVVMLIKRVIIPLWKRELRKPM